MFLEEFKPNQVTEFINSEKHWIKEIVDHNGKMYSQTAKFKAGRLQMFMIEKSKAFAVLEEYAKLREELLHEVTFHDKTEPFEQLDLFTGGEC